MKFKIVALVGNPNSGKTTLFNSLTGSHEAVGNWCGVTVEKKEGHYQDRNHMIQVVDLPGAYYLPALGEGSIDEQLTNQYLASNLADLALNVVDVAHLERQLYLTLQLLKRGTPVVVVLNRMDASIDQDFSIDTAILAKKLGCPVLLVKELKEEDLKVLKQTIALALTQPKTLENPAAHEAVLEVDEVQNATIWYDAIREMVHQACLKKPTLKQNKVSVSEKIDQVVLNRFLGIPIFLGLMYGLFVFAIHITGSLQDFFDIASRTLFVEGTQKGLTFLQMPAWIVDLLAFGVGQGINTTVTFIPVIAGMFLALSFLEASGYMARAAFVMDKVMQWAGLPGKSFVPMIIGFGCNVPAVMASRTLDNYRERVLTILMSPFMSCGARLAIYALFVSAFFPHGGQNVIFMLYLIGISVALITGFILRNTVLSGERSALIIELPAYRWPTLRFLWKTTWHRLKQFILKAGALIIILCTILGAFNVVHDKTGTKNWLVSFGQVITPIFAPMGIQADNWPATVGLVAGVLAKEVVVGTLNALYIQEEQQKMSLSDVLPENVSLKAGLLAAVQSIPNYWMHMIDNFRHPFLASAPIEDTHPTLVNIMQQRFGSAIAAFSYLLFVLLYFPCVSVVAAISRELNKKWAIFSVVWTTGFAYMAAVLFYQTMMLTTTPWVSMSWILGIVSFLAVAGVSVRQVIRRRQLGRFKAFPTPIFVSH
jgi:ferrous iron transport protein B